MYVNIEYCFIEYKIKIYRYKIKDYTAVPNKVASECIHQTQFINQFILLWLSM